MHNYSSVFDGGLIIIIVPIVLRWLLRSASSQAKRKNGVAWLEYGVTMKSFVVFFVAVVVALCVVWFNVAATDKTAVLVMILLFGGLTLPMAIECFSVRIGFDDAKIYCYSGWRRQRIIDWSEIVTWRFDPLMAWYVIGTKRQGNIRVNKYISGMQELLKRCKSA